MALLSIADRAEIVADIMRTAECPGAVTKSDLRAAIDAIDAWVDGNAAPFNSSIPLPARTALTARQKAALLTWVVGRRFEAT
jgi:hypothetical protein